MRLAAPSGPTAGAASPDPERGMLMGHTHADMEKRRAAAIRTAIAVAGLALGIYVIFFFLKG